MMDSNLSMSVIILKVNGLNILIKILCLLDSNKVSSAKRWKHFEYKHKSMVKITR